MTTLFLGMFVCVISLRDDERIIDINIEDIVFCKVGT